MARRVGIFVALAVFALCIYAQGFAAESWKLDMEELEGSVAGLGVLGNETKTGRPYYKADSALNFGFFPDFCAIGKNLITAIKNRLPRLSLRRKSL